MADAGEGDGLRAVAAGVRRVVAGFEPSCLDGEAAVRALALFGEMERLAAAGKALAARRVEETRVWQSRGVRSAAHFVASTCGSSVRSAVETLETARRLDDLPATAEALRAGKLSAAQANSIVSAAGERPDVEAELVAAAESESLPALQERCRAGAGRGRRRPGEIPACSGRSLSPPLDRRRWSPVPGGPAVSRRRGQGARADAPPELRQGPPWGE
ncbi:MAG TPA: DUF222 domain-containing protein [Acidimicrobiales bacterium]|nr:DUF222 domain-containing protein [Acidimicrobiales bacterium]